jgi:ligand-binding SRPBCC domain-containing protein
MKTFRIETEIWLPAPLDEVFEFFSNATNLETLTPPWLKFEVLTPSPIEMKPSTLIDYRLRMRGLPIRWQSEITEWSPPQRFVDEQRKGPYRLWHHTHTFAEKDGGTLVGDIVSYAVPGGSFINTLFVKRDVQNIFAYRHRQLLEIFATTQQDQILVEA